MKFSEYSLIMSVLWCDIMVILICLLHRKLWFIRIFSIKAILILYFGCFFRLFVNIEIGLVHEISLPQINFIGNFLNYTIGSAQVPIQKLLIAVWFSGSLLLLIRLTLTYTRNNRYYSSLPRNKHIENQLSKIADAKHMNKLSVVTSTEINSPYIVGLRSITICLPERTWKKRKLHIILEHEYTHFKNHDLLTILLVDIFTALFWWNIPVHLLRSHISDILEYKVDEVVLKNCKYSDARYYCNTLIEFARKSSCKSIRNLAVSVIESRVNRILIQRPSITKRAIFSTALLTLAFSTLALSYLFILQPAYQPPSADYYMGTPVKRDNIISDSSGEMYTIIDGTKYFLNEEQKKLVLWKDSVKGD